MPVPMISSSACVVVLVGPALNEDPVPVPVVIWSRTPDVTIPEYELAEIDMNPEPFAVRVCPVPVFAAAEVFVYVMYSRSVELLTELETAKLLDLLSVTELMLPLEVTEAVTKFAPVVLTDPVVSEATEVEL